MILQTAQASGTPGPNVWAQAHVFQNICFIVVLAKKDPQDESNLAAAGKSFLLRIEEAYQHLTKKNLISFKTLFESVIAADGEVEVLGLAAGLIAGNVLYGAVKNGSIKLRRGGVVQTILQGAGLSYASGLLEVGDTLFLLSADLAGKADANNKEIFSLEDTESFVETLSAMIHNANEQEKLAGLVVKIRQEDYQMQFSPPQEQSDIPGKPDGGVGVREKKPFSKKLFGHIGKSRRVALTVCLLLVPLFLVSLVTGFVTKEERAKQEQVLKVQEQVKATYEEGLALSDLNPTLATKTLTGARDIIERELSKYPEHAKEWQALVALRTKVDEGLMKALHIYSIDNPSLYFDLSFIKEGAAGVSFSFFAGNVLILDKKNNTLYKMVIPEKQGEIISGSLTDALTEGTGLRSGYVVSRDGIEEVLFATKKRTKVVDNGDWGEIGEIAFFADNLYLLDKGKVVAEGAPNEILRSGTLEKVFLGKI